ncbi:hypothetical protein, partial [Brucella sp. BRSO-2020-213]|uniref:hypothetical protein n=1 Tax=Brucella amazoniensis TaxID=2837955 RepID=UPI003850E5E8
ITPENHPQLLTNQQTVNPFSSVTQGRIRLPLPAPPPSLWRYIGPTNHNCQRQILTFLIFFSTDGI